MRTSMGEHENDHIRANMLSVTLYISELYSRPNPLYVQLYYALYSVYRIHHGRNLAETARARKSARKFPGSRSRTRGLCLGPVHCARSLERGRSRTGPPISSHRQDITTSQPSNRNTRNISTGSLELRLARLLVILAAIGQGAQHSQWPNLIRNSRHSTQESRTERSSY